MNHTDCLPLYFETLLSGLAEAISYRKVLLPRLFLSHSLAFSPSLSLPSLFFSSSRALFLSLSVEIGIENGGFRFRTGPV